METFTLRLIFSDGRISVLEQTWSQLCETLRGVDKTEGFWNYEESVINANGTSVKLVNMDRLRGRK